VKRLVAQELTVSFVPDTEQRVSPQPKVRICAGWSDEQRIDSVDRPRQSFYC
jgi:hypothetical protein